MRTRVPALVAVLLLLAAAALPAIAGNRHEFGVRSVEQDPAGGTIRVGMAWKRQELRRDGTDTGSLVALGVSDGGAVRVHDGHVALGRKPRLDHVLALAPEEQSLLAGAESLLVAATHRHDDDGGLFDRAWYDAGSGPWAHSRTGAGACGAPLEADAVLVGCDLQAADLEDTDLAGANLSDADLFSANLQGADLENADLSGAFLAMALLQDANLTGANLAGADLEGANLTGAVITGADLTDAFLCETFMPDGSVSNATC